MSFNNWFPEVPDNTGGSDNCVELRDLGNTNPWLEEYGVQIGDGLLPFVPGWNDISCYEKNRYICQKSLGRDNYEDNKEDNYEDDVDDDEFFGDDELFGDYFGAGVVPQSNILVLLAIFILLSN